MEAKILLFSAEPYVSDMVFGLRSILPYDRNNPPPGGWNAYLMCVSRWLISDVISVCNLDAQTFLAEIQTLPNWDYFPGNYRLIDATRFQIQHLLMTWGLGFYQQHHKLLAGVGQPYLKDITERFICVGLDPYAALIPDRLDQYRLYNE